MDCEDIFDFRFRS
uniref:Uncharacterized protein n=1 Tax=Anguilla anguilla TaxID=7936 RepID=A0A0E9S284_ANGAN